MTLVRHYLQNRWSRFLIVLFSEVSKKIRSQGRIAAGLSFAPYEVSLHLVGLISSVMAQ